MSRLPREPVKLQATVRDAPAWVVSLVIHLLLGVMMGGVTYYYQEEQKAAITIDSRISRPPIQQQFIRSITQMAEGERGTSLAEGVGTAVAKKAVVKREVDKSRLKSLTLPTGLKGLSLPSAGGFGKGIAMRKGEEEYADTIEGAVDRFTKELILLMRKDRLLAIWLFDESISMRDEQKEVLNRFDRIYAELGLQQEKGTIQQASILTVIASFGKGVNYQLKTPTNDLKEIQAAIKKIPEDKSGEENFCKAVKHVTNEFIRWRRAQGRRLVICIVTDESGDDDQIVEETIKYSIDNAVPVYVLGRQAILGYPWGYETWVDPETKLSYPVRVHRGPEAADVEALQIDGLHDRWDQIPSGFGPYGMTRLARETGAIYFVLPTPGEYRYDYRNLREYEPEYISRQEYRRLRSASPMRKTMFEIIETTKSVGVTYSYPVTMKEWQKIAADNLTKAKTNIDTLAKAEQRLRAVQRHRAREPLARWRAAYDLMLAQLVAYQVVQKEYITFINEFQRNPRQPDPKKVQVTGGPYDVKNHRWLIGRRKDLRDPKNNEQVSEAIRLFDYVIQKHPGTPWARRAEQERQWGFSVDYTEWYEDPRRREAKVPQF